MDTTRRIPLSTALALLGVSVLTCRAIGAEHLHFSRPFAPQEGPVAPVERPARDAICLNGSWQFQAMPKPATFKPEQGDPPALPPPAADGWDPVKIRIPSPWNANAFPNGARDELGPGGDFRCFPSYPKAWESVDMAWMRRTFTVPAGWTGKRLLLHFDAVDGATQVVVNGMPTGEHFDNFLPFDLDVTDAVKGGGAENELLVGVRKCDLFNKQGPVGRRPYVGGSMWAESAVGIWQDVHLLEVPAVRTGELLIQPMVDVDTLRAAVTVRNDTDAVRTVDVDADVQPWVDLAGKDLLDAPEPKWRLDSVTLHLPSQHVLVPARGTATVALSAKVGGKLKLWSPDAPNLNGLTVTVRDGADVIDRKYERFGWRQLKLSTTSLELNGKPIALKGDAWHFLGVPEMTRRYAWAWYRAIKGANLNAVRLHAQPYPPLFLDLADEMGVMVLDETGIWGSDGSPKFDDPHYWEAADAHVTGLVMRDRNHPSVLGYSVTNEVLVIMRMRHASNATMRMAFDRYTKWVDEIGRIDPNHPWISGDGDEDVDGRLPVLVGHYGGFEAPKHWSAKGKPWGVGECGMAYYGTPRQVAEYNGPQSYESMAGRLDGVAREAYKLITTTHQPLHAAYSSVFNVVWYGLHPMPLGMADTTHPPTVEDGVWFGPMVEGQPGMQPERLGPYCTTLNPGYDPRLPLFEKWPLYDAIAAANDPRGPQPSRYDHLTSAPTVVAPAAVTSGATQVAVLGGKNDAARLELSLMGVPVQPAGTTTASSVLVISGTSPPTADAKALVDRALSAGGTVLVWRPIRDALPALNAVLPMQLSLNNRTSTSLVPTGNDPLTAGVSPADVYFAELKPDTILTAGLAGPLVDAGRAVLTAPAVDWRRWNGRPEIIKTGGVARSEAESQPTGVGMSVTAIGAGRVVVCNLSGLSAIPERVTVARRLLANVGIALLPERELIGGGMFTNGGVLRKALVLGRFPLELTAAHDAGGPGLGISLPPGPGSEDPRAGMQVGPATWRAKEADKSLVFDLAKRDLTGPEADAAAYVSFWINSPRALDDVLGEPDVPRVDLLINGSDRAGAAWLNGKPLRDDRGIAGETGAKSAYPALVLKRGWNHLLVRVTHHEGKWEFGAALRCSDGQFLSNLQAALQPPK